MAKKKVITDTEVGIKEKCNTCGSVEFSIAKNNTQTRYCLKKGCAGVWIPKTMQELQLEALHEMCKESKVFSSQVLLVVENLLKGAKSKDAPLTKDALVASLEVVRVEALRINETVLG